jgi:translocation and assembly module TamB
VTARLDGDGVPTARLAVAAGLAADYTWSGQIQRLEAGIPQAGDWRLEAPTRFVLGPERTELAEGCFAGDPGRVCARFSGAAGEGWQAELSAPDLALSYLERWAPEDAEVAGRAVLGASLSADAAGTLSGDASLEIPSGALALPLGGQPQRLDFSGARLSARAAGGSAAATLALPLGALGGVDGTLELPGLALPAVDAERQPVRGRVQGEIRDLGLASSLVPQLTNVAGRIALDYRIAGRLAAPELEGRAALEDGAVDIPAVGLEVREVTLRVEAPALDRLSFAGGASSGAGRLTLSGETRLDPAQAFPTRLRVEGRDWVAVDVPEAEVQVSPDIRLEHDASRTALEGEVRIPYARIRPRQLPDSAVSSSPDLVVVGGDADPAPKTDPRFHAKLRVIFGDRVTFEGFGLRGRLDGNLLIIDEPGRPVIGRGRVGIVEGTYRAYGQDLKIERGYALFADSPVDNPGIDVRAARETDGVTAGLQVTGTLKSPRLSLFSTPAMTQAETLSYLLTGRAPGEGGTGVGSGALLAAGAGELTSEVGRRLGLDELRMETGGNLEEASVVAGTYLSPRLYMQYVNELASRETTVRMRYDLTDRLQIQTESGPSQGVDLFYTIER